ncbi:MAG: choice-of-anchor Q domain-containing protein [Thermodesulfobacteriota bacterium]
MIIAGLSTRRLQAAFFLALPLFCLLLASTSWAATWTVTKATDNVADPGCLRWTVANAAAGDTIVFDSSLSGQTITLIAGVLVIDKNLTINGLGADQLTVSGGGTQGVFQIAGNAAVNCTDLSVTNGNANLGGGFYLVSGSLALSRFRLVANAANFGGGIYNPGGSVTLREGLVADNTTTNTGGGVYNSLNATLSVTDCTFSRNSADYGGGVHNDWGASATVENSTFNSNTAATQGGGLYNGAGSPVLTLSNSTISGNSSNFGGGLYNAAGGNVNLAHCTVSGNTTTTRGGGLRAAGAITARGSLLAGNAGPDGPDCAGTLTSAGYNLIGDLTSCVVTLTAGDLVDPDPRLGPLADNGGPTQTHALLTGSPAVDAADPVQPGLADQRGTTRPRDGDGDGVAISDIGSFERIAVGLVVYKIGPGGGRVLSNPAGIDCGPTCHQGFDQNTVVVLTATPDAGSTFLGWRDACSGTGACTVVLSESKSVTAIFGQSGGNGGGGSGGGGGGCFILVLDGD